MQIQCWDLWASFWQLLNLRTFLCLFTALIEDAVVNQKPLDGLLLSGLKEALINTRQHEAFLSILLVSLWFYTICSHHQYHKRLPSHNWLEGFQNTDIVRFLIYHVMKCLPDSSRTNYPRWSFYTEEVLHDLWHLAMQSNLNFIMQLYRRCMVV